MGSQVAQAGLTLSSQPRIILKSSSSCLQLPNAGITCVCHCTPLYGTLVTSPELCILWARALSCIPHPWSHIQEPSVSCSLQCPGEHIGGPHPFVTSKAPASESHLHPRAVVLSLSNSVTLQFSFSCWGDPHEIIFIATSLCDFVTVRNHNVNRLVFSNGLR